MLTNLPMRYEMNEDTAFELLALARAIAVECARYDCHELRTDPWGYLPAGHPGSFCDAHRDAL